VKTPTYQDIKKAHQDEMNSFEGIFFAFSNEQFASGLKKVGVEQDKAKELVVSIGAGGYMLKTRIQAFKDMLKRHKLAMKEMRKSHKELLNAIVYELGNHEYCITHDVTEALDALGLTVGDVPPQVLKAAKAKALLLAKF